MHKIYIILAYSFVFYSCEISRIDNPLLNGHQYTLWYLKESGNENPKFLYIDCYGKFYTLGFNNETGYFFPISENSMAGEWKYDSDTSIYLNNTVYFITSNCDTFTYQVPGSIWDVLVDEPIYEYDYLKTSYLQNSNTGNSILLRETRFPIKLYTYLGKERDMEHYNKWQVKIKKSPLLDGWDYKLWHLGAENEKYSPSYEYYDKYGKRGIVYLRNYDHKWYFSNPYDDELVFAGNWYQDKNIIYEQPDYRFKILNRGKKNDTLRLYNIDSEYEKILIDTNITQKNR